MGSIVDRPTTQPGTANTGSEGPVAAEPLVALAGPTGVGKTELALQIAEHVGGEIISADSRQVYRGMAIGTAQPSPAELSRVPHHLVGFLSPREPFSVAEFVERANAILADLHAQGRRPLVVGGTHHYLQALLDRLDVPRVPPDWGFRQQMEQLAQEQGAAALHARLTSIDPASATIPPANVRRVIRALEVLRATGRPFSQVGRRTGQAREALRLAITMPRAELYARVDARVDEMLRRGWLEEVRGLLEAGLDLSTPALTSTGYRELALHLRGELTLDEAVRQVKYSTHAYIRRQYAWLRRDPRWELLERGPDLERVALLRVQHYLEAQGASP